MNKRSWITFTVVRLLAFFVPLIVLLFIQVNPWIASLIAAVIGLCVSFIFLRQPRESVARGLYEVRHAEKPAVREDDEVEDALLDAQETDGLGHDAQSSHATLSPPHAAVPAEPHVSEPKPSSPSV